MHIPEEHEDYEGAKGNSGRRLTRPRDEVDEEKDDEANSGEEERRQQRRLEVVRLTHKLAEARRHVAGRHAHEDEEEERGREELAAPSASDERARTFVPAKQVRVCQ
jgi:hypothetical protein